MEILCDECGNAFERATGEVNRSKRLGRKQFCSRNCMGKQSVTAQNPNLDNLWRGGRKSDIYSPFRRHYRQLKSRGKEVTVTLDDLRTQWNKQDGRCAFTGLQLDLKANTGPLYQASLDRIDSSKGYTPGNIQWVSVMANIAKNKYSDGDIVLFAHAVLKYQSDPAWAY